MPPLVLCWLVVALAPATVSSPSNTEHHARATLESYLELGGLMIAFSESLNIAPPMAAQKNPLEPRHWRSRLRKKKKKKSVMSSKRFPSFDSVGYALITMPTTCRLEHQDKLVIYRIGMFRLSRTFHHHFLQHRQAQIAFRHVSPVKVDPQNRRTSTLPFTC